ncbi:MAG: Mrp/NBP35 family ATP-binding protein [marine benthic group bacterium]|jgi:ATP-binding protein involved in chromosome partitioning|nr:Mrp/NBP35 family ATP-binding protein [Gemmatimonadota bacterium]MCL7958052.1 Mrp/NBP35 family ATP-binding protein [Gemmatimonadota bacterium]MCL7963526.1 Mrp/NBP35 family ATP-binding protein [Candidatus Carthagonibacter metallireducens]MCL7964324.1 Mrp/NBP35 family ATP-binding protein [Gemmatimonadota bacterium]MCL7990687.1 Mrp/NBP35 family ATP-binding protein [Gemmatimonadota bacterium]
MDGHTLKDIVMDRLARVQTGSGGTDVVTAGIVRSVEVDPGGDTRISLALRSGDDPGIADSIRLVAMGIPGVSRVSVASASGAAAQSGSTDAPASAGAATPRQRPAGGRRPLPVMAPPAAERTPPPSPGQVSREEASRHPSEAESLPGVRHVIAVSSGKGGVGKSTVSTNLAAAWAKAGLKVGLMDADIYGPDVPTMFGADEKPRMRDEQVIPVEKHGVKLMSLGFLVGEDTPAIWRGPIIMGIVRQFLHQVAWGELDYLIVDLPPGTGDAQLSLVQLVSVTGAVMVTTPQDVAVQGVLKGIRMFESVDVPVLGLVENMRGFVCPDCDSVHELFGAGGGEALAASLGVPFLGAVPLGMAVREQGDRGVPPVIGQPDSPESRALLDVADRVESRVEALEKESS